MHLLHLGLTFLAASPALSAPLLALEERGRLQSQGSFPQRPVVDEPLKRSFTGPQDMTTSRPDWWRNFNLQLRHDSPLPSLPTVIPPERTPLSSNSNLIFMTDLGKDEKIKSHSLTPRQDVQDWMTEQIIKYLPGVQVDTPLVQASPDENSRGGGIEVPPEVLGPWVDTGVGQYSFPVNAPPSPGVPAYQPNPPALNRDRFIEGQ